MKRFTFLILLASLGVANGFAGTMSFNGVFSSDDNVVQIPFLLASPGLVSIQTTSFADGTLGFEPVLTLYDGLGNLLLQDATGGTTPGGCSTRSIDSVSGFCLDALLNNTLTAGSYTLALTESDNVPGGPTLADGFPQTGAGNFTGVEYGGGSGSFLLFNGSQRTAVWALTIATSDVTTPTPEPASLALSGGGLVLLFAFAYRKKFTQG